MEYCNFCDQKLYGTDGQRGTCETCFHIQNTEHGPTRRDLLRCPQCRHLQGLNLEDYGLESNSAWVTCEKCSYEYCVGVHVTVTFDSDSMEQQLYWLGRGENMIVSSYAGTWYMITQIEGDQDVFEVRIGKGETTELVSEIASLEDAKSFCQNSMEENYKRIKEAVQ